MRKIHEILRLGLKGGLSERQIARSCGVSRPTVKEYLRRAEALRLVGQEVEKIAEEDLERLFKQAKEASASPTRPQPDWGRIHEELRRKGVTVQLLWEEYKQEYPEGYQLSQFYEYFRRWKAKLGVTLRQTHKAGEKMFVDYAGQTMPVIDPQIGQIREAEIFVAVLGASNYTFVEAAWDQGLSSWIGAHIRAFEYFGGVPEIVVVDNLKSGVSKACRYEPDLNPTYQEMARHYGVAIIPARAGRPRDKAKVEVGVQVAERWILAALRNRIFRGLADLNSALHDLQEKLNHRPFKKLEGSRRSWFERIDRPALKPLAAVRYEFAAWKKARVNIDYHVELEGHYYSVPYALVHEEVEVRSTQATVEIFFKGRRVASHLRNHAQSRHSTQTEHMPKSHQRYLEWTPSRILAWAASMGAHTEKLAQAVLESRPHPEQGYRSCLGILRLGKYYGRDRLEAASARALALGAASYKSVRSILENALDRKPLEISNRPSPGPLHANIRGQNYYR